MITNVAAGVQAFTSNAFLVDGSRHVLVDTGANFDVVSTLREHVTDLDAVVVTHTHPDHVGNLEAVTDAFDVEVWGFDPTADGIGHRLRDGETVAMGDHTYEVLHTPGHKDDHVCCYARTPGVLFAGDLVFQNGSFGRTDLPEGDRQTLIESIDRLLAAVDPDLAEMHTGHGPSVTTDPYRHVELAAQMARRV
ncbi:MBL fold metallo-hydrolase [Natronobiforma cellulositropha]|uniref:MBL fold metallo-hydrolase n=1 Tax=Natronobiforma cellulositropha TaxID=1679076 RepID=UPI0021D6147E|nr:MBL fold metallo-hydrolase [Natronobiforma cellulositropha]